MEASHDCWTFKKIIKCTWRHIWMLLHGGHRLMLRTAGYWATLLPLAGHWTAHADRLLLPLLLDHALALRTWHHTLRAHHGLTNYIKTIKGTNNNIFPSSASLPRAHRTFPLIFLKWIENKGRESFLLIPTPARPIAQVPYPNLTWPLVKQEHTKKYLENSSRLFWIFYLISLLSRALLFNINVIILVWLTTTCCCEAIMFCCCCCWAIIFCCWICICALNCTSRSWEIKIIYL